MVNECMSGYWYMDGWTNGGINGNLMWVGTPLWVGRWGDNVGGWIAGGIDGWVSR